MGDLKRFHDLLDAEETFFVRHGTFVVMEKLLKYVYRNLFRRVLPINQARESVTKKSLLHFDVLRLATRLNGIELDTDELECIVANLIFDGFIKGYIAHRRGVVVSKNQPFPSIQSIVVRK